MEPESLVPNPPDPAPNPPDPAPPPEGFWDHPIRRSHSSKVAGGVIRGLADAYGFDAVVGRVIVVVATLISGIVVIPLYLALWLALPVEPAMPTSLRSVAQSWRKHWAALVLVLIAASAVFNGGFFSGAGDHSNLAWGVLLGIAAVWLWKERKPGDHPLRWSGAPSTPLVGEQVAHPDRPWLPGHEPWMVAAQPEPVTFPVAGKRKRRERGPSVARWVWAGWLVFLGLAITGDRLGWYSLSVAEGIAVLLAVVGAILVVSAFRGGGRWLMPLAVVLFGLVFIARSADWTTYHSVTTLTGASAWQGIDQGVGHVVIDLRSIELAPTPAMVTIDLGVGLVEIIVSDDVDVVVKASIGAGDANLLDRHFEGAGLDEKLRFDVAAEVRTVELDVNIGLGSLRLTRAGGPK